MKKYNKVKLIFLFIIAVIIISLSAIWLLNKITNHSIDDLPKINATDTFNQTDREYIVYFWQSTCTYCKQIENDVLSYSNSEKLPIYIVDMQNENNISKWYDWEGHHKQYDQVIGKMEDGKEVLNEGINIEQFQNDEAVSWAVVINDENELVATHNTAYGNEEPQKASDLEITGTPTMIKVKDGMFEHYAVGVDQTLKALEK